MMRSVSERIWRERAWFLGAGVAALGLLKALLTYRLSFGLGDPATFYIFARNTAAGEVIYKDFIHFRMPGFYYYCAAFIKAFGDNFSSIYLATAIEGYVLYPLVMFASSKLITRNNTIATVAAAACVLVSGIFQLRAGLGLLAVAVYVAALRKERHQTRWLVLAGAILGLDFTQGQEVFLFACAAIVIGEILTARPKDWQAAWWRLVRVAAGAGAVILPFLIYIWLLSDLKNFFYYAFDYALIIQPKFMNLPFPGFNWQNLMYYLPFALYLLVVAVFWCTNRLSKAAVIVVSFGMLRLASAMGRADLAHLIFSIPELFFIVPWAFAGIDKFSWRKFSWPLTAALAALIGVFALATQKSFALLLAPMVLGLLYRTHGREETAQVSGRALTFSGLASAVLLAIVFNYSLTEDYYGMRQGLRYARHGMPTTTVSGVVADQTTYAEVTRVTAAVKALNPDTIFSYPIEPFYYSLANKHASRFITFEPQTTPAEVDQAIADLERSRPGVVILDMLQAEELSPSISRLSEYITSHYEIDTVVALYDYLKIMKPRRSPALNRSLLLEIWAYNAKGVGVEAYHVQVQEGIMTDALKTDAHGARFPLRGGTPAVFEASVRQVPKTPDRGVVCGEVKLKSGTASITRPVCSNDGIIRIDLSGYNNPGATITLEGTGGVPVLWVNPTIKAATE